MSSSNIDCHVQRKIETCFFRFLKFNYDYFSLINMLGNINLIILFFFVLFLYIIIYIIIFIYK